MSEHWQDCWLIHPACCVAEVRRLKGEVQKLQKELHPVTTHAAYVPCGGPGPTWAHCSDDPPSQTP